MKKEKRRSVDKIGPFSTLLGEAATVIGQLVSHDSCVVYGKVEGGCEVEGLLVLGEGGYLQGNIVADSVQIFGEIKGDIKARDKIELLSTAKVKGNITGAIVAIAEGAVYQGKIHISPDVDVIHFEEKRKQDTDDV